MHVPDTLRQDHRPDRRWVPFIVFALGMLITLGTWHLIKLHEQSEVRWVTKLAAQVVRSDINADLEYQVIGLDRLAMLWKAADPAQELWSKNAELYIQHRPGCIAVEWLTATGEKRVTVAAREQTGTKTLAFGEVPKKLLKAASNANAPMFGTPESVPDGSSQWIIAYPVFAEGQPRGFIVAFFDAEQSLEYILSDLKALGFSFAVSLPQQPEYMLSGSNRAHEQEWGEVIDVPLSGVTWQLRVWPKSDVVNTIKSRLPEVTLAAGTALSFLLCLTLYFAFSAAHSSARTKQANQALCSEIDMRKGVEEELRRAHVDLETRVEQRTTELAGANALLHKEVTDHQRAEAALRELTSRLFQVQDDERRHLARELHDGAVQDLVALNMDVRMVLDSVADGDPTAKQLLVECAQLAEQAINELRTLSYLLHPPYFDELGLSTALRDLVKGFDHRSGVHVTLEIDANLGRLGRDSELAIFRIVQESLANVYRHSESPSASISLRREKDFVRLTIADSGRGIPPELISPASSHLVGLGIASMRERAHLLGGHFNIQSSSTGTRVEVVLPLTGFREAFPSSNDIAAAGVA